MNKMILSVLFVLLISGACLAQPYRGSSYIERGSPIVATAGGGYEIDGTIYTAKVHVDGAVYVGAATVDPCGSLAPGYIFFKSNGMPCFCNAAGVDLSIYDGSTACF